MDFVTEVYKAQLCAFIYTSQHCAKNNLVQYSVNEKIAVTWICLTALLYQIHHTSYSSVVSSRDLHFLTSQSNNKRRRSCLRMYWIL